MALFFSSAVVKFEPAPFDALFCLLAAFWLASGALLRGQRLAILAATLGPYALLQITGIMGSTDPSESIVAGGVTIYLVLVTPVLASLAGNRRWPVAQALLTGTLAAGVLSSIVCTLAYVGLLPDPDLVMIYERATGGYKDPNVFAAWLVPSFIYAAAMALDTKKHRSVLYSVAAFICGLGLLLAFSRGAWGQCVVALAVMYVLTRLTPGPDGRPRKARPILWLLAGAMGLGAMIYFSQNEAFMSLWESRSGAQDYDQERFLAHREGWTIGLSSLTGLGPGRVDDALGMNVHNTFLHVLIETGWLSLLSYTLFLVASIGRATMLAISAPNGQDRLYFRVAAACLIGLALESWIVDIIHWRHFWYLGALAWIPMRVPPPLRRWR